jgi:hypothetical protein
VVDALATATVEGVTVTGGTSPVDGTCTGTGMNETCPERVGEAGGGIDNLGTLTVRDAVVTGNHAASGGPSVTDSHFCFLNCVARVGDSAGSGGAGGGIYNGDKLTIVDSTISHNTGGAGGSGTDGVSGTGTQAGPGSDGGGGGHGGHGGGVYSDNGALLTITGSTISDNAAGVGGGGGSGSDATASGDDGGGAGGAGNGGDGGGIYSLGAVTMSATTVDRDASGQGGLSGGNGAGDGSGFAGPLAVNGGDGNGGGVELAAGSSHIVDATIVADVTGGATPQGGGASGGGISVDSAGLQLAFSTIAGNTATIGSGISSASSTTNEVASIVADNVIDGGGTSCSGTITDGGANVAFGDVTCPGVAADPKLGPLADNGGATQTMALGVGSPAIDLAGVALCAPTFGPTPFVDQRGVLRPQGSGCDAGAYEHAPPSVGSVTAAAASTVTATVSAAINANAQATAVSVAYGTTSAYGAATSPQVVSGETATPFAVLLTGLSPDTTYHLAITATNADGTTTTADQVFATPAAPPLPPPPPLDKAPSITHLALSPSSFPPVTKAHRTKRGTKISYTDSAAATTTFTVQRATTGVRKGKSCVAPPKKKSKSKSKSKACTRYVTVKGKFSHHDAAGRNTVAWTGDLGGNALTAGTYRLSATPTLGRTTGPAATHSFTIKHS